MPCHSSHAPDTRHRQVHGAGTLLAAAHALCSRSAAAEEALARAADALAVLCRGNPIPCKHNQASSAPSMGPAALLAVLPGLAAWLGSSAPDCGDEPRPLPEGAFLVSSP